MMERTRDLSPWGKAAGAIATRALRGKKSPFHKPLFIVAEKSSSDNMLDLKI